MAREPIITPEEMMALREIAEFDTENPNPEQVIATFRKRQPSLTRLARDIDLQREQFAELASERDRLESELQKIRRERDLAVRRADRHLGEAQALRNELRAIQKEQSAPDVDEGRSEFLRATVERLRDRLAEQERLIAELQAETVETPDDTPEAEPRAVIEALYADLSALAAERAGSGFELSDVEVDLRAPVARSGGRTTLRFSRAALDAPENAARFRFRLARTPKIRRAGEES